MTEVVLAHARQIGRDIVGLVLFSVELLALTFPALINGGPLIYPDTRGYFMGGRVAIEKIENLLSVKSTHGIDLGITQTLQRAHGVRSAFYSIFTYVPAAIVSLSLVIILQAFIVVTLLKLVFRLVSPGSERWESTLFIVVLGLSTTISWCTSNVMPDIFTPVMVISLSIMFVYWQHLMGEMKLGLMVAIGGSMVMHMTNLPIALFLIAVGIITCGRRLPGRYLLSAAAVVVGVVAMLAVGVVGFHQWSISPQSPPFFLARSIEDGPGRLYLQEHCPRIGLAMCRHLDGLTQDTEKFIWGADGVYESASPEEQAAIRSEDKRIYLAAAEEHPWLQLKSMVRNAALQLILFTDHEYAIPSSATYNAAGMEPIEESHLHPWQTIVSVPQYLIVVASLIFLARNWRGLPPGLRQFSILMLATVVIEVAAGAFSEPAPRYEARVIWLLPMVAALAVAWRFSRTTMIRSFR